MKPQERENLKSLAKQLMRGIISTPPANPVSRYEIAVNTQYQTALRSWLSGFQALYSDNIEEANLLIAEIRREAATALTHLEALHHSLFNSFLPQQFTDNPELNHFEEFMRLAKIRPGKHENKQAYALAMYCFAHLFKEGADKKSTLAKTDLVKYNYFIYKATRYANFDCSFEDLDTEVNANKLIEFMWDEMVLAELPFEEPAENDLDAIRKTEYIFLALKIEIIFKKIMGIRRSEELVKVLSPHHPIFKKLSRYRDQSFLNRALQHKEDIVKRELIETGLIMGQASYQPRSLFSRLPTELRSRIVGLAVPHDNFEEAQTLVERQIHSSEYPPEERAQRKKIIELILKYRAHAITQENCRRVINFNPDTTKPDTCEKFIDAVLEHKNLDSLAKILAILTEHRLPAILSLPHPEIQHIYPYGRESPDKATPHQKWHLEQHRKDEQSRISRSVLRVNIIDTIVKHKMPQALLCCVEILKDNNQLTISTVTTLSEIQDLTVFLKISEFFTSHRLTLPESSIKLFASHTDADKALRTLDFMVQAKLLDPKVPNLLPFSRHESFIDIFFSDKYFDKVIEFLYSLTAPKKVIKVITDREESNEILSILYFLGETHLLTKERLAMVLAHTNSENLACKIKALYNNKALTEETFELICDDRFNEILNEDFNEFCQLAAPDKELLNLALKTDEEGLGNIVLAAKNLMSLKSLTGREAIYLIFAQSNFKKFAKAVWYLSETPFFTPENVDVFFKNEAYIDDSFLADLGKHTSRTILWANKSAKVPFESLMAQLHSKADEKERAAASIPQAENYTAQAQTPSKPSKISDRQQLEKAQEAKLAAEGLMILFKISLVIALIAWFLQDSPTSSPPKFTP